MNKLIKDDPIESVSDKKELSFIVPVKILVSIHDLAEMIIEPLVIYDADELKMAKKVIEQNAHQARLILERLPKHPDIKPNS